MKTDNALAGWRDQIDELDQKLIDLLRRRMEIVSRIGEFKKSHDIPALDEKRFADMLTKRASLSGPYVHSDFIKNIFTLIHQEAITIEGHKKDTTTIEAKRLEDIPEYIFSHLSKLVSEVEKKTGKKVLNLGPGSPDTPPSPHYIEKFSEFIKQKDAHMYPPYGASDDFIRALIGWYSRRFEVSISKDELLPLMGAKDGISHLPLALVNEGDEVLIPDPGYPAFTHPLRMAGGVPVFYDLTEKNNFTIDLQELEKKVTKKTKMIWVNFPSNPTGQVATLDELRKIVAFAKHHSIILIYDNAYSEITFEGFKAPSILQIEEARDVAAEIGSFSKTFSFAGFRMGWIVGRSDIVSALAKTKSQMDSGLSIPLQKLGAYALMHEDKKWRSDMIGRYEKRRAVIGSYLKTLGLTPSQTSGSLFIWAKIPDSFENSEVFAMELLTKKQILLTPGTAFGKNGARYVRASICVNTDNIEEYFSS